jgi:hypothetical protein
MKTILKKTLGLALAIVLCGLSSNQTQAQVSVRLVQLFESSAVIRQVMHSPEGLRLMRSLGVEDASLRALSTRLSQPAAQEFREVLEGRLLQIDRTVQELREHRLSIGAPALTATQESFFIELLARRRLKLSRESHALLEEFRARQIDFFEEITDAERALYSSRYQDARLSFLDESTAPRDWRRPTEIPASQRVAEEVASREVVGTRVWEAAPGSSRRLIDRTRTWLNDMKTCQFYRSPSTQSESRLRYLLTGLAVNETVVTGAYIVGMGVDEFKVEELTTDMLVAAVYTLAGASALRPNQRFQVQWLKVATMIGAQDIVDSTIYLISPMHRLQNGGEGNHTLDEAAHRLGFNWAYTLGVSGLLETSIFELVSGLECLYPQSGWIRVAPGLIRLSAATASSLLYYELRGQAIGH